MIIDVSEHNGHIDWAKVAPHIDGAIIRIGYGQNITSQDDKRAAENIQGCIENGIPYGIYLYSYAATPAMIPGEIAHMQRWVDKTNPKLRNRIDVAEIACTLQLGVWYDLEENSYRSVFPYCITLFNSVYGNAGGIYMSASDAKVYLKTGRKWIASWGKNDGYVPAAQYKPNADIWQYTSKARIPGIHGYVDANLDQRPHAGQLKTVDDVVDAVVAGKFGNGEDRKNNIYHYIQQKVNQKLKGGK